MTRRERYGLLLLAAVAIVAVVVRFGIPLVSRLLAVRSHHPQFVSARKSLATAVADPDHQDVTSSLCELEEHMDALVRVGYFQHKVIRLKPPYCSDAGKALLKELLDHSDLDRSYFEIRLMEPGVLIWGTPEQVRLLEDIVRQHEKTHAGPWTAIPRGAGLQRVRGARPPLRSFGATDAALRSLGEGVRVTPPAVL